MYSCFQPVYVFCKFFLIPGGDSNVILKDCWSKIAGKRTCASVVSQRRKSGCGLVADKAFSKFGNQATTKCKFLRQSHVPFFIAVSSIFSASCCWPPPMANSAYFSVPTASD